jgi:hydroxymethylglutaryl-CoA reductase
MLQMQNNDFLDFTDKNEIVKSLSLLTADTKPTFGILTAQLMVEHLAITIQFSNGNRPLLNYKEENRMIDYLLSNQEMPKGTKFFLVGNNLAEPITNSLSEAIDFLIKELHDFDEYFIKNPNDKPTHGVFGNLDKSHWETAHSKHFTHHFKQFGIF